MRDRAFTGPGEGNGRGWGGPRLTAPVVSVSARVKVRARVKAAAEVSGRLGRSGARRLPH